MREYFIFYILLAVLIVLLVFVVLLYSDYHSRTIVPGMLSSNYNLKSIGNEYSSVKINPDVATSGSLLFGTGAADAEITFSFIPIAGDEKRRMSGTIILLLGSSSPSPEGNSVFLRVKDLADGEVIGDESEFYLPEIGEWGLTPIRMNFKTKQTDTRHNITLEVKSAAGEEISAGNVLLNSAYVTYY